jgi:phage head maturation protease
VLGAVLGFLVFFWAAAGPEEWELEARRRQLVAEFCTVERVTIPALTWTRDSGTVALNWFRDSNATRQAWKMRGR